MKTNWYLISGIALLAWSFGAVAYAWGDVRPAYSVDWALVLGGIGGSVVPFALGYLAGRFDEKNK